MVFGFIALISSALHIMDQNEVRTPYIGWIQRDFTFKLWDFNCSFALQVRNDIIWTITFNSLMDGYPCVINKLILLFPVSHSHMCYAYTPSIVSFLCLFEFMQFVCFTSYHIIAYAGRVSNWHYTCLIFVYMYKFIIWLIEWFLPLRFFNLIDIDFRLWSLLLTVTKHVTYTWNMHSHFAAIDSLFLFIVRIKAVWCLLFIPILSIARVDTQK